LAAPATITASVVEQPAAWGARGASAAGGAAAAGAAAAAAVAFATAAGPPPLPPSPTPERPNPATVHRGAALPLPTPGRRC